MRYSRQPKPCEVCGTIIMIRRSRLGRTRYCSRRCQGKVTVVHLNQVRRHPSTYYVPPPILRGPANPLWKASLHFACERCGKAFEKKPWEVRRQGYKARYCSAHCRDEFRRQFESGPNSPFWVGGPQTYRGRNWERIRLLVVERQRGRCALCQKYVGQSLPVHHKRPARTFPRREDANGLDNLIGLCQSCHIRSETLGSLPGVRAVDPRPYEKTCIRCGGTFAVMRMSQRNCPQCWSGVCGHCGRSFQKWSPSDSQRYCSRRCYDAFRSARAAS